VKKGLKLGGVDKQLGELSRRIDLKGESAIKTAERMNVTSSSIKAIFEKGFFAEFNPNILTAIRRFGQELAQARVLPVQATSVYTEPAATKRPTGV